MDKTIEEKRKPRHANERAPKIKTDNEAVVKFNYNIAIFNLSILSNLKLVLLYFTSQNSFSARISSEELEKRLSFSRKYIITYTNQLIKLGYIVKINNYNKQNQGSEISYYSLTNRIFEIN